MFVLSGLMRVPVSLHHSSLLDIIQLLLNCDSATLVLFCPNKERSFEPYMCLDLCLHLFDFLSGFCFPTLPTLPTLRVPVSLHDTSLLDIQLLLNCYSATLVLFCPKNA